MSTIALEAIAAMIKVGDLGPIHRGEFRREHCTDAGSETLFDFLSQYRQISQGMGHIPAISVIYDRFPHISLPETSENPDISGLVHECRVYKMKISIQALAERLVGAVDAVDPLLELREVRAEFDNVLKDVGSTRDLSFEDCALEILDDYNLKQLLKSGIPWPWKTMTEATQGIHPGEFYIIAGRPKSRKTFVALYIAAYLVKAFRLRVLFISPEMMPRQVMLRFIAFIAEVHYAEFKKGELDEVEEEQLYELVSMVHDMMTGLLEDEGDNAKYEETDLTASPRGRGAFIVTKATGQPVSFIESKIKEHRPHVVFVDSFYRLGSGTGQKYDADWKAVTSTSRLLKDLCTEHEVPLIGTHQLNREADEKVGGLSNLGYADAIGQDCDLAIRVITAKRTKGDFSALYMLGARETSIEGVIIHNEPCSNFTEIEPITAQMHKRLLEMLSHEDTEEKLAEAQEAATKAKKGPNAGAPGNLRNMANKSQASIGHVRTKFGAPKAVEVDVEAPDPNEVADQ